MLAPSSPNMKIWSWLHRELKSNSLCESTTWAQVACFLALTGKLLVWTSRLLSGREHSLLADLMPICAEGLAILHNWPTGISTQVYISVFFQSTTTTGAQCFLLTAKFTAVWEGKKLLGPFFWRVVRCLASLGVLGTLLSASWICSEAGYDKKCSGEIKFTVLHTKQE